MRPQQVTGQLAAEGSLAAATVHYGCCLAGGIQWQRLGQGWFKDQQPPTHSWDVDGNPRAIFVLSSTYHLFEAWVTGPLPCLPAMVTGPTAAQHCTFLFASNSWASGENQANFLEELTAREKVQEGTDEEHRAQKAFPEEE